MATITMKFKASSPKTLAQRIVEFPSKLTVEARQDLATTLASFKEEMKARSTVGPLFKKSGRLGRSWAFEVLGDSLGNIRASMFSFSDYSVVHERGDLVTAKIGSWIFIPTLYNLAKKGKTAKRTVKEVIAAGGKFGKASEVPLEIKAPMPFVTKSMVLDNQGFPMFTQVKSAKYQAVLGTVDTSQKYEPKALQLLGKSVVRVLKAA